jgi:hypothetical protein
LSQLQVNIPSVIASPYVIPANALHVIIGPYTSVFLSDNSSLLLMPAIAEERSNDQSLFKPVHPSVLFHETHHRSSLPFPITFSGSTKLSAVKSQPLISNLFIAPSLQSLEDHRIRSRTALQVFHNRAQFATRSHNFAAHVSTLVHLPLVTLVSNHGAIFVSISFPIALIPLFVDQLSQALLYWSTSC